MTSQASKKPLARFGVRLAIMAAFLSTCCSRSLYFSLLCLAEPPIKLRNLFMEVTRHYGSVRVSSGYYGRACSSCVLLRASETMTRRTSYKDYEIRLVDSANAASAC